MDHRITIHDIRRVTPDVRQYRCERPDDYAYQPGQATEAAVDWAGLRDEPRPFTFTSLPEDEHLEFTIKSYPDHDGVTEQIGRLEEGDALLISDAFGAITDNGPGVFIAGGAGVTPFVAILRARARRGALEGCHLIFSNRTEDDIILREELEDMEGLRTTFIVTGQPESPLAAPRLDAAALERLIDTTDQAFYVCGPPAMVDDITTALDKLGVDADGVTLEQ